MNILKDCLIDWPERVAGHIQWVAPLFARVVVGWVFLWSGWGKLNNLPAVTENFVSWHIPFPHVLTPFVSGVEFFGGILLLLGFDETEYLALFLWLAIAGAGIASLDWVLGRSARR